MKAVYETVRSRFNQLKVNTFQKLFTGRMEAGLTASEVLTIYVIDMLDMPTIKTFADYVGISQSNATYRIDALVEKGYVDKVPSQTDRRESHLFTTWKCKKLLREDTRSVEEVEAVLRSRFTEEQLETAKEIFEVLLDYSKNE